MKSGKGRLTITNENQMGATTINGGTVTVNALANNTGVACGALGDVSQTITLPVITDQQINVSGNVMLSTPSGISFTINKGLKGTDAVITKTGAGTLTTGSSNTYAKLIIRDGSVNCSVNNNKDQLPKTVEFVNGTLTAGNNENTNIDNSTNFVVEKGMTGTFYGGFRSTYTGKLTGEGTFNAYTGGVRCYFNGDWSEFSGTLNIGKNNRQNKKAMTPRSCWQHEGPAPGHGQRQREGTPRQPGQEHRHQAPGWQGCRRGQRTVDHRQRRELLTDHRGRHHLRA